MEETKDETPMMNVKLFEGAKGASILAEMQAKAASKSDMPFRCNKCLQAFKVEQSLTEHVQKEHVKVRPHKEKNKRLAVERALRESTRKSALCKKCDSPIPPGKLGVFCQKCRS